MVIIPCLYIITHEEKPSVSNIYFVTKETEFQILNCQPKISPLAWILARILIQISVTKNFSSFYYVMPFFRYNKCD